MDLLLRNVVPVGVRGMISPVPSMSLENMSFPLEIHVSVTMSADVCRSETGVIVRVPAISPT